MDSEIKKIIEAYKEEIQVIDESNLMEFSDVERGIQISRKYLQKLRVILRNNEFKDKKHEILFFKEQKPIIYGKLKFYAKLYKYLIQKPRGTNKSKKAYIDAQIKLLQDYYYENSEFCKYYRQNGTFLDEFYFLRGNDNVGLISETSHFYTDEEFSTSHDNAVAKIMAYDLLIIHYKNELNNLKKHKRKNTQEQKILDNLNLNWTANKIDLIELTYALISTGAVKGDIKDLATLFEKVFDTDLGNYYRSFLKV